MALVDRAVVPSPVKPPRARASLAKAKVPKPRVASVGARIARAAIDVVQDRRPHLSCTAKTVEWESRKVVARKAEASPLAVPLVVAVSSANLAWLL